MFRIFRSITVLVFLSSSVTLATASSPPSRTEPADTPPPTSVHLASPGLYGDLFINETKEVPRMSGFRTFSSVEFPGRNLFSDAGWNFEHIFNGASGNVKSSGFTPRTDPCLLVKHSEISVSLVWPRQSSSWDMDCEMKYTFTGNNSLDIEFQAVPGSAQFPLGYVGFMWASYVACLKGREIHFFGTRDLGEPDWMTFGREWPNGNRAEMGSIAYYGVKNLPFEQDTKCGDIIEDTRYRFLLPFYYGVVDGDGTPLTNSDAMAFIMMFDQAAPIRFTMWNFSNDTQNPAWDWEYVVHNPQVNQRYGYTAHFVYKKFTGEGDVLDEYVSWLKNRGTPKHNLKILVSPPEAATVFPPQCPGDYPDKTEVFFGVLKNGGWKFSHWEGAAHKPDQAFTGVTLMKDEVLTAVFESAPAPPSPAWNPEPAAWPTLYESNLSESYSRDWSSMPECEHVIEDGAVTFVSPNTSTLLLNQGASWSGYRFSAHLRVQEGNARLLFRNKENSRYALEVGPQQLSLFRENGATVRTRIGTAATGAFGEWHDVMIAGIQDEIKAYVDNDLRLGVKDSNPLPEGTAGIEFMPGSRVTIDRILVTRPQYSGSTPTEIDGIWPTIYDPGLDSMVFSGGLAEGHALKGVLLVNSAATPSQFDIFVETMRSSWAGYWQHGIYRREGDFLITAMNMERDDTRPANFTSSVDSYVSVSSPTALDPKRLGARSSSPITTIEPAQASAPVAPASAAPGAEGPEKPSTVARAALAVIAFAAGVAGALVMSRMRRGNPKSQGPR